MAQTHADACSCSGCAENDAESDHLDSDPPCYCPLEGIIDVVSRKHVMQIVSLLGAHGRLQYSDLEAELDVASESTFADNLKRLVEADLVHRESYDEVPPRVEYSLTPRGEELDERLQPLLEWAADN